MDVGWQILLEFHHTVHVDFKNSGRSNPPVKYAYSSLVQLLLFNDPLRRVFFASFMDRAY